MAKEKKIPKGKKKSKGKIRVKGKSKESSRSKAVLGLASLMPQRAQKSYQKRKGLTTFFAVAATEKRELEEKKAVPKRTDKIAQFRKIQKRIDGYQDEKEKQTLVRFDPNIVGNQSSYTSWRLKQSNKDQYPKSKDEFYKNWEVCLKKNKEGECILKSEDGRKAGVRVSENREFKEDLVRLDKMEEKYVYLASIKSEVKRPKGSAKKIEGRTELGITGVLKTDNKGNEYEITNVFNYLPPAKPIYDEPVMVELAKNPTPYSKITLDKLGDDAIISTGWIENHYEFMKIVREKGWNYNSFRYEASIPYNKQNASIIAKTIQELRKEKFDIAISPEFPIPDPDRVVEVKGDERFDIFIEVDRKSFKSKVTGERSEEFLQRLDVAVSDSMGEMTRDDKLAFIKEHPTAIPLIREYRKQLKADGIPILLEDGQTSRIDVYVMDKLQYLLPVDKKWHFVNHEEQTIPIGFVYHYALDQNDINMKIIDNRPLYLKDRTPADFNYVDDKGNVFALHDYQRDAVDSAVDKKSGIISAATGSGKTEIGAFIIGEQGLDAVWFAHRTELVDQAEDRMENRLGMDVGVYGDRKEIVSTPAMDVNVITTRSASMIMRVPRKEHQSLIDKINDDIKVKNRLISSEIDEQKQYLIEKDRDKLQVDLNKAKMKLEIYDFIQNSKVQIFDESHHMTALEFGDIARATPQARYRYGLSATPFGNTSVSQKRIEALMGDKIVNITASKLINEGYLARPNILMVDLPYMIEFPYTKIDTDDNGVITNVTVYTSEKDMNSDAINKSAVVRNEEFNGHIVDFTFDSKRAGLNTLILVKEVEHGLNLQDQFADKGMTVDFLTSTGVSKDKQKVYLNRFRDGKTDTLIATIGKAGEGVDIPYLDVVVLAHGGASTVETMQRIGRAMRLPKGSNKKECVIVDFERKEKYLGVSTSSTKAHDDQRRKIYSYESAFDVKDVPIDYVNSEFIEVAKANKVKSKDESTWENFDPIYAKEKYQTREERKEQRMTESNIVRMEKFGTMKRMGKKGDKDKYSIVPSATAKEIAKGIPAFQSDKKTKKGKFKKYRLTALHVQHLLNKYDAIGVDPQTLDWGTLDNSLTIDEAVSEWEAREVKGL